MLLDFGGFSGRLSAVEFDTYQRLRPRIYEDAFSRGGFSVRVVDIDDASEKRIGAWPWPHAALARLVGQLKDAGAAIVVLDFPLSQREQGRSDTPGPANSTNPQTTPADPLAATMTRVKTITGFALGDAGNHVPAPKAEISLVGAEAGVQHLPRAVPHFESAAPAPGELEAASAGVGALNIQPDADGITRGVPMLFALNNRAVPALQAEVLRVAGGQPDVVFRSEAIGLPGLASQTVIAGASTGQFGVPLRKDGAIAVYFTGPRDERIVSASALDEGGVSAGAFRNAIVFVSPPDRFADTPFGRERIGEVRAEAMENLLLGEPLKPALSPLAGLAFLVAAGMALVVLLARTNVAWAGLFVFAAIAGAQALSWLLFARTHALVDTASPNIALALAFAAGLGVRMIEVARTRAELKESFSDLLPSKSLEEIAHAPARLKLDGETRVVTCLSCGIRGFPALAASFADDPAGFTRVLNMATAPLIEDAVSHGGMIGPLDGEFFTAYWNAPLDDPEHAMHACEAATRMTMSLAEVNEQLSHERRFDGTAFAPLEIGIGIATGPAITGALAARGRNTYSVAGECTALAGRIRAISGQYGPAIVVSESTREAANRGYAFLEVDFLSLGSKEQPIKLYAMLGNPLVRASPKFRALATFHEHIFQSLRTQQWDKTRELIEQCRKLSGASQKMYDLHLARIAWFESHPPGAEWDGAFRQAVI